ncbi:MAG: hypothetical protein M5U12_12815 [Verrucomicrobia bacterium]|nr:hypothetical protein [Verrucomicrobiota bacterium]
MAAPALDLGVGVGSALGPAEFLGAAVHPGAGDGDWGGGAGAAGAGGAAGGGGGGGELGAVWEGYTLERSPALRPPAWKAAPGVSANAIRLPRNDAPAFFRLRR